MVLGNWETEAIGDKRLPEEGRFRLPPRRGSTPKPGKAIPSLPPEGGVRRRREGGVTPNAPAVRPLRPPGGTSPFRARAKTLGPPEGTPMLAANC